MTSVNLNKILSNHYILFYLILLISNESNYFYFLFRMLSKVLYNCNIYMFIYDQEIDMYSGWNKDKRSHIFILPNKRAFIKKYSVQILDTNRENAISG